jgi:hypothetical protein
MPAGFLYTAHPSFLPAPQASIDFEDLTSRVGLLEDWSIEERERAHISRLTSFEWI